MTASQPAYLELQFTHIPPNGSRFLAMIAGKILASCKFSEDAESCRSFPYALLYLDEIVKQPGIPEALQPSLRVLSHEFSRRFGASGGR